MISEVELSGIKYPVTEHENISEEGLKTYSFSTVVNDKTFSMKTTYTSKHIEELPLYGFAIEVEEELRNILYFELKAELFGIVYNTSFKEQCDKAAQCKNDEELYAASAYDPIFTEWLRNFDGEPL